MLNSTTSMMALSLPFAKAITNVETPKKSWLRPRSKRMAGISPVLLLPDPTNESGRIFEHCRLAVASSHVRQSPGNCVRLVSNVVAGTIRANDSRPSNLLAAGYGWFPEGFDTLDLKSQIAAEHLKVMAKSANVIGVVQYDADAFRGQ